jgi:hypothetical protein
MSVVHSTDRDTGETAREFGTTVRDVLADRFDMDRVTIVPHDDGVAVFVRREQLSVREVHRHLADRGFETDREGNAGIVMVSPGPNGRLADHAGGDA